LRLIERRGSETSEACLERVIRRHAPPLVLFSHWQGGALRCGGLLAQLAAIPACHSRPHKRPKWHGQPTNPRRQVKVPFLESSHHQVPTAQMNADAAAK